MQDLDAREFLCLGVLAVSVLLLGVFPGRMLGLMDATMQHLVQQLVTSKLPVG
jgi:NADH-quinone oxidoreductase subunit M